MTSSTFALSLTSLPTLGANLGGKKFPVGRIFCVGQNYTAHALEMGGDPDRNPPFFFSKWASALVEAGDHEGAEIPYPKDSQNLQPEVELAIAVHKGGKEISKEDAGEHICGFAVSLDMTKRDIQLEAKKAGRPWEAAKNFDFSCPIAPIATDVTLENIQSASIKLLVNGKPRQTSQLNHMIWGIEDIVAKLSHHIALMPGDLILTGTPEGVAPVEQGDVLQAKISGLPDLSVKIV